MNRYTTEDFEELGNIAEEICCEKKLNPFVFKKFTKKGVKKDEDDKESKPKSKGKKGKKEIDESYLAEFDENQGIPWEPINEMSEMDRQWGNDDSDDDEDVEDTGDEYTRMALGDFSSDDDDSDDAESVSVDGEEEILPGNVGETEGDETEVTPSEEEPMITDKPYDADSDDFGGDSDYEPVRSVGRGKTSLDKAMDAASDDSQADENGEVKYPITLTFANGDKIEYDGKEYYDEDGNLADNKFDFDEIVDNLTSEHSGEDGDSRIIEINGEPADEWAERHGIDNVVPPEEHEETDSDLDDTEIEDMESEPEEISRDKFREIDLDNFDF